MRAEHHPVSLRQLQYFVAVADTRSFHRAAALCHVSQPALSAQIAVLEQALGVRLLERDRRRVLPTAAGQDLLERARRVLVEADDLADAAKRLGDPLSGMLRIGVIPTISPYLLPEVVPSLRRKLPLLKVQWIEDKTDVLVDRLHAGTLDAALLALEARLGDLEQDIIAIDPFVLAMPRGHALAKRRAPARLDDLNGVDVLLLEDGHCLRDQALSFCARGRTHELDFRATSLPTLVQMVAGGAGVTLLPRLALPVEARRSQIALRRFATPAPHRTIGMVWRRGTATRLALQAVASTLRDAVAKAEPKFEKPI
ncbi:MAG: LysR family transcriptional regulator [Deltaproteobacteria bacterium]|nr:LysR family transcriptional regulator [Deltaproteobacteria bacterium]